MKNLKKIFVMLVIIPVMLLCGCNKFKPTCKAIESLNYYFEDNIKCEIFNLPEKTLSFDQLTSSKLDKTLLDSYAQFTLTAKSAEIYHLYIEYIYFMVYTNEDSEYDMNIYIDISNVVKEEDIGKSDVEDNKYSNMYTCRARKNGKSVFKVYVNRTVATATGLKLTINILNSEIYATDEETLFRWAIYDFKIYGESRAY